MNNAFGVSLDNLKRQIEHLEAMQNQIKSLANPVPQVQPQTEEAPKTEQPQQLETQQIALLKLFDEFVKTDEGKALSANLQRFARFVQSKQSKLEW